MKERQATTWNGLTILLLLLGALGGSVATVVLGARGGDAVRIVAGMVAAVEAFFLLAGLFMVEPNQGRVLTLFGAYRGSERRAGLRWANPFMTKRAISLRVRNFETAHLKANDADGNPVEIAAVVVWRVIDTFDAVVLVDNYEDFVHVQSESVLRNLAKTLCGPLSIIWRLRVLGSPFCPWYPIRPSNWNCTDRRSSCSKVLTPRKHGCF